MLDSETSGQYPKPQSPHLIAPETELIFGSTTELPPDPLLDHGAFINVNITSEETLTGADTDVKDHVEGYTDHNNQTPPETESPVPLNAAFPAKTPTQRGRRKKSDTAGMEMPTGSISSAKPEWLPTGWYVEDRVRTSGASAGAIDKYYCDPNSGYKFRSRLEVIRFQQTGNKRKKTTSNDVTSLGSSGNRKEKKIRPRTTTRAFNFDFVNVPEQIGWVLTGSSEGTWTPFVGDEKVPETSKEEWAATFSSLATGNNGC